MSERERYKVAIQFKQQLLELYDSGTHIIILFRMYLGFLIKFADLNQKNIKKRYSTFTRFQIADMEMSIWNAKIDYVLVALETAWIYTRRGGKSRGLTVIAVFFALLNKDVIWRTPYSRQLKQAGKWFDKNPFVEESAIFSKYYVKIYNSPEIDIGVLSAGRIASQEADILIYDEGGMIEKNKVIFDFYENSLPMIAGSDFKHIIHATTPARYTAIQDIWDFLKVEEVELDTRLTAFHTYKDCYWITPEHIERERRKHSDTPWYIEQNYECKWVVIGGAVFIHIAEIHTQDYLGFAPILATRKAKFIGVDFNNGDPHSPHYLLTIDYDDNFVYILDEYPFFGNKENMSGLSFLFDERWRILSMEVEDDLWNTQFTEQTKSMGLSCIYFGWSESEKQQRVQEVRNRVVIIDKTRASLTYKNLLEAAYDKGSRLAKLEKRTDQHGLDCLLHAMHQLGGTIHVSQMPDPMQGKVFAKQRILHV